MIAEDSTGEAAHPASVLVGTWRYPADEEPSGVGFFHISEDGRLLQFVYDAKRPERRIPMRVWYSVESSSELRVRGKEGQPGWICSYSLDDEGLTLVQPNRDFVCRRVPTEEIPVWFREALAARILEP